MFRLLVHAHVASAVRGLFKVESPCYLCQQQKIAALPSKTVHEPAPARKTSIDSLGSFGVNIHFTDALPNELAMLSRAFAHIWSLCASSSETFPAQRATKTIGRRRRRRVASAVCGRIEN